MKSITCPDCKGKGFISKIATSPGSPPPCATCNGLGSIYKAKLSNALGMQRVAKGLHKFQCSDNHVFYTDNNEVNASNVKICPVCKSNVSGIPF